MKLRPYCYGEDWPLIEAWVADERTHALWCARRFPWPLRRESFEGRLRELEERGDRPFTAVTEAGEAVGFVCVSPGPGAAAATLKFVLVAPEKRGGGFGRALVTLAAEASGAGTVRLSVFSCNAAARSCYERAGFTADGAEEEGAFSFGAEVWGRCGMVLVRGGAAPEGTRP